MDIEFPPWLGFLRDLCPQWPDPPASETGMREIGEILQAASGQLGDLIPELAGVPAHTAAVLTGDTADAFTQQFTKLLVGQYSVHHDVDAIAALAELADNLGTEIQYFKLMAISTLVITAATIAWALFNADWSLGASLAEIPVAELLAENSIRELAEMVLERIGAALASTLSRTALARMLVEGGVGAAIGAGQELAVQAIQVARGWRSGIDIGQAAKSALTMGVSGMAAGVVGHDLSELLGQDGALPIRMFKGAVTGAASGMAANAAGNLLGGNDVGANTFLGAALGFAGGFAPGHAEAATSDFDTQVSDSAVPANAIDTHPTLRFEKQPDGTFAWPGETANDSGPQAHTASAPAPKTEPAVAAGELGAGAPAGNGWAGAADPGVAAGDRDSGAVSHGSPSVGDPGGRSVEATSNTPPAAADTGHLPGAAAPGVDPPPVSVGSRLPPEDTLDLSTTAPVNSTGLLSVAAGPAVSDPPLPSNATNPATPTAANAAPPSPAPTVSSAAGPPTPASSSTSPSPGPTAGLSSPTSDPHTGPADTPTAGKSSSQPAGAPAAARFDTAAHTAAHTGAGAPDTTGAEVAPTAGLDRATQAGRSEAGSHAVSRQDSTAADRQQRPAEPVTKRQDPSTRPDANRRDSATGPRGRPGKLRSGVARDTPDDLQPAAAMHTSDPLATAEQIGVIKARHDDNGPGPSEPGSQNGDDGSGGHNTPDPDTADGGAGGHSGGAGHGGAGHRDGSDDPGGGDDSQRWEAYLHNDQPSREALENPQPGDDFRRVAEVLTQVYGRGIPIEPGMLGPFETVGSDAQIVSCAEVEETLSYLRRYLGRDSSAVVAFWDGGSHRVFLAVNSGDEVHYYDPVLEQRSGWPGPWDDGDLRLVGYLGPRGDPLVRSGDIENSRLSHQMWGDIGWSGLSPEQRSALTRDTNSLINDFISAMNRGVDPRSEEANELAEDHRAFGLRSFPGYSYESHRADARLMLTNGQLRQPYELREEGLALYVHDVILANANSHLGRPDDPDTLLDPRQPGNLPSGADLGSGESTSDKLLGEWNDGSPTRWTVVGEYGSEIYEASDPRGVVWRLSRLEGLDETDPFPAGYLLEPRDEPGNVNFITGEHGLYGAMQIAGDVIRQNPAGAGRQPGLDDDSGPDPGEPESHKGGGEGRDGRDTPDPGTAGGGSGGAGDGGAGHGDGGGDEPEGDGDSHPVERYFQTHRPSVDAVENWEPGDAVHRIANVVSEIYRREIHIEPEPGPAWRRFRRRRRTLLNVRLFEAAGTDEQLATRAEMEATLRYLGRDSSAIVRDLATGILINPVFLAVNIGDEIHFYDPRSAMLSDRPPWSEDQNGQISVGYLDAHGTALLPFDRHSRSRWGFHMIAMNALLAELPEAGKLQLADVIQVVNADFATAMDRGVAPGSDEANGLAERHFALASVLVGDYDYGLHRYFGRRLVTEGGLRDPYEWRAPGLARYVRDVIVANADQHLGPPDDPEAQGPAGPHQPGNPPSGREPGTGTQSQSPSGWRRWFRFR